MKKKINNKYILIYLIILLFLSYFFLYFKHQVGNDSTISEWLINYEGGFTRRGFTGHGMILLSRFFDLELRWTIFLSQSFFCTFYFILLWHLLKNLQTNKIINLSIFTPIFILYPVAEIEVLARKEIIVFTFFLIYLLIPSHHKFKNFSLILFSFFSVLVWEPIIFFFPLIFLYLIIENRIEKLNLNFVKFVLFMAPGILLALYMATNPLNASEWKVMASVLKNEFGERCYMSCDLLLHKSSIYQQSYDVFILLNFERVFRYLMVIIVGFGPLIILLKYTIFDKKILRLIYFIILFPIIVLFFMMTDWGRTVNMFYTFSILSFLYLYEKKIFKVSKYTNKNFFVKFFSNRKLLITFFIVFSFGWNPKTSIVGDVGSKPGYQIPKKK